MKTFKFTGQYLNETDNTSCNSFKSTGHRFSSLCTRVIGCVLSLREGTECKEGEEQCGGTTIADLIRALGLVQACSGELRVAIGREWAGARMRLVRAAGLCPTVIGESGGQKHALAD